MANAWPRDFRKVRLTERAYVYPPRFIQEAELVIGVGGTTVKDRSGVAGKAPTEAQQAECHTVTPQDARVMVGEATPDPELSDRAKLREKLLAAVLVDCIHCEGMSGCPEAQLHAPGQYGKVPHPAVIEAVEKVFGPVEATS
jgi:hypothetical protein